MVFKCFCSFLNVFSSTDSAIDIETEYIHNLKPKVKKRRKRKSNLALNQSRKKKKKNYGEQIRIRNVEDNYLEHTKSDVNVNETLVINTDIVVASEEEPIQNLEGVNKSINSDEQLETSLNEVNTSDNTNTDENFVNRCIRICRNDLIHKVVENFDREGLLIHFMSFMSLIASGQLSVVNMAVLLSMEVALLFSLASTTQMRYRVDTSLFWESVLSVGGPRTLRLFSSDKHHGMVNSGDCERSKYDPKIGSFNFAVPNERLLKKSRTGLPKVINCGLIRESIPLLDMEKEFVLSLDGKQVAPGLLNESDGDVNLWGYEGPPSLEENLERLRLQESFILEVAKKASIENSDFEDICSDLKLVVQILTKRIRSLREAKVKYEQLRARFGKKIKLQPEIGSRYTVAFSDIDSFIRRADIAIDKLLKMNVEWCAIMAELNGNLHCFQRNGPVLLDSARNSWILRHPDTLDINNFLLKYPKYLKQRSELWHEMRTKCLTTGSTMHSALGLRTLKDQKEHYKIFVSKTASPPKINEAMQHGIDHEVNIKLTHISHKSSLMNLT